MKQQISNKVEVINKWGLAVSIILIIIIVNIWFFVRNNNSLETKIYDKYDIYHKIIERTLVINLQEIVGGQVVNKYKTDLIFKTDPVTDPNTYQVFTSITPYSIEIHTLQNDISIDLISLKEYFKDLFPKETLYEVNIANNNVLNNSVYRGQFAKNLEYDLGSSLIMQIILSTKDSFIIEQHREIWFSQLWFSVFSCLVGLILLIINFKTQKYLMFNLSTLEGDLISYQRKLARAQVAKKMQNGINNEFIKKATEMYLEEVRDKNIQLFPLSLFDKSNHKINLINLAQVVHDYFCDLYENIDIHISRERNFAYLHMGREVLYQLVISIVENIAIIIKGQTDKTRTININYSNAVMEFEFISFPLTLCKIKRLSEIAQGEFGGMFLLDFKRIIQSLEKHGVFYELDSIGNKNTFRIKFLQKQKRDKGNVIDFVAKR